MGISFWSWKTRIIVFFGNLLCILVFLAIGWYLDRRFGTNPKILIASLVVSFPVTQVFVIKLLRRLLENKVDGSAGQK